MDCQENKWRIILNDEFQAKIVADIDFNQENGTQACKIGMKATNSSNIWRSWKIKNNSQK